MSSSTTFLICCFQEKNNAGNGTRSLDFLRSNPTFVQTEKNLTICINQKLRKPKPRDLSTGKMYVFISSGRFFSTFFHSQGDSNYSSFLYCILQIILCFSTAPEICFPICFPLENEKLFFPVRKNAFLSPKHDCCFLCGNVLRNNN